MIRTEKLYKSYDDVIALNGIDLDIRDGAITGLLGPNGAGKTTLVSILTGIIKKTSGRVVIDSMDLETSLDEIRSISSIVPQTLAFYPTLTAYENLEYFGVLYGLEGKKLKERIDFSIEVATLHSFLKKRSGKLSGGMQRRLNLAIGMLNSPKILYLDEPTVGVDAQSRRFMLEMIQKINREQKTTIVYTSHYISEIEQISDEVVIIDYGNIILNGRMDSILASSSTLTVQADGLSSPVIEQLRGIQGIDVVSDSIQIEKNDLFYSNTMRVLSALKDGGCGMRNIQYNTNKLEDLYLHLTNKNLRDDD
jgi:ABC-2 type transport system ATP-binding protein